MLMIMVSMNNLVEGPQVGTAEGGEQGGRMRVGGRR